MIWLVTAFLSLSHAALLNKISSCKTPAAKDAHTVMVIKQWHLPPKTITKGFKERYPQEKNQSAIYLALSDKIKKKKLQMVVAEGCEGEINQHFAQSFNGWDYDSLKAQAFRKHYDRIITLVPLKLEARYADKVLTMCGDNNDLIQEGNLRLSNLRGWAGFWTRLTEPDGEADKTKLYAEAAAELLKVPKSTPVKELLPQIKEHLKEELNLFQKSLADRNDSFVKMIQEKNVPTAAIVIGGLHAEDLKSKLETAGFACDVYEPSGYQRQDEQLIQDFKKDMK